jgi:L-ascorbate metabolism protein UlaG (beta-lactamase superfamily)
MSAITWVGHATVLIELDGLRVLTDPVLRDRIGPLVRIARTPPRDVDDHIDGVMLSHLHADHADLPTLRRIAKPVPVFAPHQAQAWLRRRGLRDIRELRRGDQVDIGPLKVTAVEATHERRRRPFGVAADPIGYVVQGSRSVYFAGDTDLFDGMVELRGSVDVALLPVWGWGPRLPPGHLNPRTAATAAALIKPAIAIPIHWGTFAPAWSAKRSPDPQRPAREFAAFAEQHAPATEVRILMPGERVAI